VDFLIVERRKPMLLVEAKLADETPSPALLRFQRQFKTPAVQLVRDATHFKVIHNGDERLLIAPPERWLPRLP
jgi:hypothetical protein